MNTYEVKDISGKDNAAITFLYGSPPGRALLKLLANRAAANLAGYLTRTRVSKAFIRGFIKKNNIRTEDYIPVKYRSFNDFFIREIKKELRPFPGGGHAVAAPCDGKLTAYPITADSVFRIKNSTYSVAELLRDKALADEFTGGVCLIFRLTPEDYHRYAYIDDGETVLRKNISGVLHTIRPIAQRRYNVYAQNSREYTVMRTKNFGKVIQMEVGALFIGRIKNYATEGPFRRGQEKGMFEYGGSTVVMLFQKGAVAIDGAIYKNTLDNKETVVRMGQKIGEKLRN